MIAHLAAHVAAGLLAGALTLAACALRDRYTPGHHHARFDLDTAGYVWLGCDDCGHMAPHEPTGDGDAVCAWCGKDRSLEEATDGR